MAVVVEYLEGRSFWCAWVLEAKSRRLSVLAANGREMTVSLSRILLSSPAADFSDRQARLAHLAEREARREELSRKIDLVELWEVLAGEGEEFGYPELAGLVFGGEPEPDQVAAVIRAVFRDGLRFKFAPAGAWRHEAAEVERLSLIKKREEAKAKFLHEGANWLARLDKGDLAGPPEEEARIVSMLKDFAVFGDESGQKSASSALLRQAGLPQEPLKAFELLVALGEFSRHENLDLIKYNIQLNFSEAALQETARAKNQLLNLADRREDLSGLPAVTVDTPGASDLDDAITFNCLPDGLIELGIHIADAALVVTKSSSLAQEALSRGSSVYLPETKIPMLPDALSDDLLSLRLGELRPTFSLLARLNAEGEVLDYKFQPSLIKVSRQMTFAEADQNLLDQGDLIPLYELARKLTAARTAKGALNINVPRLNVYLEDDGRVNLGLIQWETPARRMLGEFMVLANRLAAEALQAAGWACPYRAQAKPGELLIHTPVEEASLALLLAQRRKMGRSSVSLAPEPHHGLGLAVYTGFTAPMRRFLDLVVAQQLRALYDGRPPVYNEQEMLALAVQAEENRRLVQRLQNNRSRYWLLKSLETQTGKNFKTLVFDKKGRRTRVCVLDFMLELDLFESGGPPSPEVGAEGWLKLAKAEARSGTLRFQWAD